VSAEKQAAVSGERSDTTRTKRAGFVAAAVLLAVVHVSLVNHFVPLTAIFSDTPLQGDDFDLHIGQVFRVMRALEGWGKSWSYDVSLLAGQPEGTITDSGSKAWELWAFALAHVGVPRALAFNSFILVVMLACPLLLYAAARCFGSSQGASLLAAAMASSLWFFDSHIHWIWFVGMVSWGLASCLAILTLGLFHRFLQTRRLALAAPAALCLSVGLLIHPYTFFVLAPPMAACYLRSWRTLPRAGHIAVAAMIACALAVNGYWVRNAMAHWHYILNSAYYAQADPRYFLCDLFDVLCSGADTGVIGTRTGFRFLYLGLAAAGLYAWRSGRDSRFLPLSVAIAVLYGWAYLGGFVPGMQQTQPYRQITPASLFTTLPAAAFVERLWRERLFVNLPRVAQLLVAALGFALAQQLVAGQVLYFLPRLVPDPQRLLDGSRSPISKYGHLWHPDMPSHVHYGVPHDPAIEIGIEPTIAWLSLHVPDRTRILVEGGLLGERLAWRTNFEVLGGFFERNVAHVYANYFREHHLREAEPVDFLHYLRVFAVEWVVGNRSEFELVPGLLERVAVVHGRNIYRTRTPVNRVLQGGGSVRAGDNRIEVRGSDPQKALLLSYHWHEALRCKPDCRIEREPVDIDHVGLIRIPAPHPAHVVIWNSYQSW
jgi:hypothetical protein